MYQATGHFMMDFDMLLLLNQYDEVTVTWYKVVDNKRPIARFQPNMVLAVPHDNLGTQRLRPSKAPRAGRHPPVAAIQDGVADEAAAADETDAEQETDDEAAPEFDALDAEPRDPELDDLLDAVMGFDFQFALESLGEEVAAPEEAVAGDLVPFAPGVAASSGAAPPGLVVPAPPPPPPPPGQVGPRSAATVTYEVPGGSISFYESKGAFQAVCENKAHGRCVLTRTRNSKGVTSDGFPRAGRPVGFLAAWLAHSPETATKTEHWEAARFQNTHTERAALRATIVASGESGRLLVSCERPLAEGEGPEPATLEGYWP